MIPTRRQFLTAAANASATGALGLLASRMTGSAHALAAGGRQPNIIVILTDDQGYADAGCYGSTDLLTPNIDALAAQGVRFTDGYVSSPICSPTRAGMLTGRYQQRFGHEFNPPSEIRDAMPFGLPLTEHLLSEALKAGGYATGLMGKWHLGLSPQFHPTRRGFDEFFGFLHGWHPYHKQDQSNPIMRGHEQLNEPEYLTNAFTREAVSFIQRHREHPFFLYLAFNAPHVPMEAPAQYLSRFPNIKDPGRRTYAAMMSSLDDGVGAVMKELANQGLDQNTLVVFLSDNGGFPSTNFADNTPLRSFKGNVFEGGIRVPFIMRWPNRLPAQTVYRQPVSSLDIFPTILAASHLTAALTANLDGVDLLPHLAGENMSPPHAALYWRYGHNSAIRTGRWKLVQGPGFHPCLYDLDQDIGENKKLGHEHPEIVASLQAQWTAWDSQLTKPLWSSATDTKKKSPPT